MCLCVFSAWAKVELTMHDSTEVYLGDSTQIPCQYSFTDANKPRFVMTQWFVVSSAGPSAKTNSACLERPKSDLKQGPGSSNSFISHRYVEKIISFSCQT